MSEATQTRGEEVAEKVQRVRDELDRSGLDAILFTRQNGVSWITGGLEDPVIRGFDPGLAWVLVGRDSLHVVTANNEAPRLSAEEPLAELGFEVEQAPWYSANGMVDLVTARFNPDRIGNDGFGPGRDISRELVLLRMKLTEREQERMKALGADACAALEKAARQVGRGMTEHELSAEMVKELELVRIFPHVVLVGADQRRREFRHPTVSTAPIEGDVLAVIVGVREGLNLAASRTVSIGEPDPQLAERHRIACEIEAAQIAATRPGTTYTDVFEVGVEAYARLGYPGEWEYHSQGGPMTYGPRDFNGTPRGSGSPFEDVAVEVGHSYAWNPTVQGAKSEDTFIVGADGPISVSNSAEWPSLEFDIDGVKISRPAILEVD